MHGVCDGEKISLVGGVIFVLHPVLHCAWSDGWEKSFFDLLPLKGGLQILDVRFDLGLADVFERLGTVEDPGMVPDGSTSAPVEVFGELNHVATEDRGGPEVRTRRSLDKAAQPFACVTGEIRFSQFAVVDDVDAALDLFLYDFRNGA